MNASTVISALVKRTMKSTLVRVEASAEASVWINNEENYAACSNVPIYSNEVNEKPVLEVEVEHAL